jgi:hypothetical protein
MADEHEMRIECAKQFALLSSELSRAANGRIQQAEARVAQAQEISQLTSAIAGYHAENQRVSGEIKETLNRHLVATEGRMSVLEQSLKSAHGRLTFLQNKVWWLLGLLVTGGAGFIIARMAGAL